LAPTPLACRLQLLVSWELCGTKTLDAVRASLRGGVDLLQLREKHAAPSELAARARLLLDVASQEGIPVLINDDLEVARKLPVAGVHLGQEDATPEEARRVLGDEAWIGFSTHNLFEVVTAAVRPVTHLGLGACFPTATKPGASVLPRGTLQRAHALHGPPLFAIGGIGPENVRRLVECGVKRIAVSASILRSPDPEAAAAALRAALESCTHA